jgi:hypothetical protein
MDLVVAEVEAVVVAGAALNVDKIEPFFLISLPHSIHSLWHSAIFKKKINLG